MYPHQAERLDAAMAHLKVEALVAASAANVAYLTGFRSLSRGASAAPGAFAVYAGGRTALVVPARDAAALLAGALDADHVICHGRFHLAVGASADASARRAGSLVSDAVSSADEALERALDALGVTHGAVGLDSAALPGAGARVVAARLKRFTVVPATDALSEARLIKGPYEIQCLQQALHAAEESLHEILGALTGTTAQEVTALYTSAVARRQAVATTVAIAFGPDTAVPGAVPGERPLRPGDLVRLEVGCVLKGYHAAVARVAVLGEPSPEQQALHDALDAGLGAALAAIRPGAAPGTVHEAAAAAARERGIPGLAEHHVGHGIGLEPVEEPWLAAGAPALDAGMVLSVQTGYYELGACGATITETVLVNNAGAAVMNRANRGLLVLD